MGACDRLLRDAIRSLTERSIEGTLCTMIECSGKWPVRAGPCTTVLIRELVRYNPEANAQSQAIICQGLGNIRHYNNIGNASHAHVPESHAEVRARARYLFSCRPELQSACGSSTCRAL